MSWSDLNDWEDPPVLTVDGEVLEDEGRYPDPMRRT